MGEKENKPFQLRSHTESSYENPQQSEIIATPMS